MLRQIPGPTQPHIQWVKRNKSPGVKRPGSEAEDSLHLVSRLKQTGDIPSFPLACTAHIKITLLYIMKKK
jgi:hypothetical protein